MLNDSSGVSKPSYNDKNLIYISRQRAKNYQSSISNFTQERSCNIYI